MQTPAIEVKNVSFSYPDGTKALEEVSFSVDCGRTLGVVGPNGAGKSTLLLLLGGILSGTGSIRILGTEVCDRNIAAVRRAVGLVFQDPDNQLFSPTVFDDVAFGPLNMGLQKQKVQESVAAALDAVDMSGAIRRSSHHLSFGEKKRICLATVLSMNPQVLLLDEPTANLDPRHRREFIALLKKLAVTKVVVTHDLELVAQLADTVLVLDRARAVIAGPARTMLTNEALLLAHGLEVPRSLVPGDAPESAHDSWGMQKRSML
jgi:cobalt/nickel transport system ATP-binding protein